MAKLYGSAPTQVNVYSGEPRVAGTATFDASIFNANPTIKAIQGTISYLQFKDDADRNYLDAHLTDSSVITLFDGVYGPYGTFAEYGVTQHVLDQVGYIDLTATTITQDLTKEVKKLYFRGAFLDSTGTDTITHTSGHHLIHEEYPPNDPFDEATFITKFNSWLYSNAGNDFKYYFYGNNKLVSITASYDASDASYKFRLRLTLYGGRWEEPVISNSQDDFRTACALWGISINMTPVTASQETSTISLSGSTIKRGAAPVKKLYGSINGATKLVYEAV